jgi:hypothetical protein
MRAEAALTDYADLHARILDPADRSVPKRFLLLPEEKIWHGLGNQQLTFLYGLIAALLSGRALLGRPFRNAEDCYDFPIRLDPAGLKRALGIDPVLPPRQADYPGWAPAADLLCADPIDFSPPRYISLLDGQLAVWNEARGIPHAVFAPVNPHHRERLDETFGADLLHHLARFLFRPSPRLLEAAEEIRERMRGRFALGLQLRCGFSSLDLYLRGPRDRQLFWATAQRLLAEQSGDRVLFLATDSMAARDEARALFGDRLLHTSDRVAPDGDPFGAALDQYLLTECDALIVTERSTFGYGAHLLSGVVPWAVDGKLGTVRRRPDSRSGLYKASRWEAPSTWPWQIRNLERCPCFTSEMSRDLDPDGGPRGVRAALRWLAFLEIPIAGSDKARRLRRAVAGARRSTQSSQRHVSETPEISFSGIILSMERRAYSLKAPGRSGSGASLRLPGRDFPRVDDRLVVPEVTRDEIISGRRVVAHPAQAPHADQHGELHYVLRAHIAPGYLASIDLLTRHSEDSDFASDSCVYKKGIDPATGTRYLEEMAFEVVSEQKEGNAREKAEQMHQRGVRRIFAIFVKSRQVCEWCSESRSWRSLEPGSRIEDSCLAVPLAVAALLEAGAADNAVVEALAAKGNPAIRNQENAAEARGEARLLLRLLEEKFGPLDASSRERVRAASSDQLLAWGDRLLKSHKLSDVIGLED